MDYNDDENDESFILKSKTKLGKLNRSVIMMKTNKKFSLENNLGEVLDQFLAKLRDSDKYLENGINNINFAEAAVLLQNATDVYCKEVDLLYDHAVHCKTEMVRLDKRIGGERQEQEAERVEDRRPRAKRKKRETIKEVFKENRTENEFSFKSSEIFDFLNCPSERSNLEESWKRFERNVPHREEATNRANELRDRSVLFEPQDLLENVEDDECVGQYDDLHSIQVIRNIYCNNKSGLGPAIFANKSSNTPVSDCEDHELSTIELNSSGDSNRGEVNKRSRSDSFMDKSAISKTTASMELLPIAGSCDSAFFDCDDVDDDNDDSHIVNTTDNSLLEPSTLRECSTASETFIELSIADATASSLPPPEAEPHLDSSSSTECTVENTSLTKPPAENASPMDQHETRLNTSELPAENQNPNPVEPPGIPGTPSQPPISSAKAAESPITNETLCTGSIVIPNSRKRLILAKEKGKKVVKDKDKNEQIETKRRKLGDKLIAKLTTGVEAPFRDFEKFYRNQYKAAEHEGVVEQLSDSDSDSDNGDDHADDEDSHQGDPISTELIHSRLITPPIHEDENEQMGSTTQQEEPQNVALIEPALMTPPITPTATETTKAIARSTIQEVEESSPAEGPVEQEQEEAGEVEIFHEQEEELDNEAIEALKERQNSERTVAQWRTSILPKLKALENQVDFDIHDYSTKIINSSNVGEVSAFKDLVRGKSASEVSRYFIAALQLANTSNIEIMGSQSGRLSNDTFQMKLLSVERYHESLDEFQAPSEETFNIRLARAQQHHQRNTSINAINSISSTPSCSNSSSGPPRKRYKSAFLSPKKLLH